MADMRFFLQKLSDDKPSVRRRSAQLLESYPNSSVLFRLKALLPREDDPSVQAAMRHAIEKLTQSLYG